MKGLIAVIAACFVFLAACETAHPIVTAPPSATPASSPAAQSPQPDISPLQSPATTDMSSVSPTPAASPEASASTTSSNEENKTMKNPEVTIIMENGGTIVIELLPDKAPNTVKNFISLANSGFYNGTIFHRILRGQLIQGGDPEGSGYGGPGYSIKGEFANNNFAQNDLDFTRGVIAMARSTNFDSAGSQFFIMIASQPAYKGDYAPFGIVTKGIDIVDAICATPLNGQTPVAEQKIKTMTVDTFGETYSEPDKLAE